MSNLHLSEKMKAYYLSCCLLLICSYLFASGPYCTGDTLNCLALNGLKLRDVPKGKALATIKLGDQVVVLGKYVQKDTIELIPGDWIKVRYNEKEGFVFDGYLSSLSAPSLLDSSLTDYLVRVAEKVGKPVVKTNSCKDESDGESYFQVAIQQYQGKNLVAQTIDYQGWEWGHHTVNFDYANLEEIYLIFLVVHRQVPYKTRMTEEDGRKMILLEQGSDENGSTVAIYVDKELDWRVIVREDY